MEKVRNVTFKYSKVGMGSVAGSGDKMLEVGPDRFFLDVGNGLYKGVIDHHHKTGGQQIGGQFYRSATKLVTAYPNYIIDNLSEQVSKVEIILHESPDFDCFAAAYLTRHLIEYGVLPEGYETFAEYADLVDAGKMKIRNDNLKEVFAVAYGIEYAVKLDLQQLHRESAEFEEARRDELAALVREKEINPVNKENLRKIDKQIKEKEQSIKEKWAFYADRLDHNVCDKWYSLFDLVFEWINIYPGHRLDGADIFGDSGKFQKEIDYVQKDYSIYNEEMSRNEGRWEKVHISLPKIEEESGKLYDVVGLVFNEKPQSRLTKNWARIDSHNSSDKGFIFTFIPIYEDRQMRLEKDYEEVTVLVDDRPVSINRVIISVDPNSGYNLKGLAEQLEEAECKKENDVFALYKEKKRDNKKKRPGFVEEWCTNDDPWYDGRNFSNTIVDAPRRGSLLTVREMKEITLHFTVAKVLEYGTRLVIPFLFDNKDYEEICRKPDILFKSTSSYCLVENDYFTDYIKKFLFCTEDAGIAQSSCRRFGFHSVKDYQIGRYNSEWSFINDPDNKPADIRYPLNVIPESAVLFKYGVGFLCLDIGIKSASLNYNDILSINYLVKKEYLSLCTDVLAERPDPRKSDMQKPGFRLKCGTAKPVFQKPLLYTTLQIDSSGYYESEKLKMIYKLSNIDRINDLFSNDGYIKTAMERLVMEMDASCTYGFSKSGGALLCVSEHSGDLNTATILNEQMEFFKTVNFEIFIFALQQRISLMKFASLLSEFDRHSKLSDVKKLRNLLMNFITQGWFSQITNHEVGQEIYKRWQEVLECGKLYGEVLEQIQSVDDYRHSSMSKLYENASLFVFPALLLLQILSSGLLRTKAVIQDLDWWYTAGLIIISTLFTVLFVKKRKGKS